jgi:CHAD domain-containing protein
MTTESGTAPSTVREVEVKLRVHGLYKLPDLVAANVGIDRAKRQVVREMRAIYHDTRDLRLFRWGVTLRRREGGPDAGWHMKLPVKGITDGVRDELQLPLDAGQVGDVPAALATIAVPFMRSAALVPIADVRTQRTPYILFNAEGVAVAEMVDDRVAIYDNGEEVERYREIEVEALEPDFDLEPIVKVLVNSGATRSSISKAAAALGPDAAGPPDVLAPAKVGPHDSARDAITAFIRKHVRAFITQDVRVRRDLPDSVHQMRVAARRLRSGLKAFGPLVDKEWADHLRTELGWAAGELGGARDTEVLLERLDRHAEALGERDAALVRAVIDPQLNARLDSARGRALTSLSTPRHLALLDALVAAAADPQITKLGNEQSRNVLPALVDKSFHRLAKEVRLLELDGPAEVWHEARISAKRARYAAEAVSGVFGSPAVKLADALSEVTEVLGDHQDACIAQDVLREMAETSGIDGRTGFALGLLHEHELESELHNRLEFDKIWPHVVRVHKRTKLS